MSIRASFTSIGIALALFATGLPGEARAARVPLVCALDFDGIDDRLMVSHDASFPDAVYTITAWILTSSPDIQQIVSRGESNNNDVLTWGFGILGGRLFLQIENTSTTGTIDGGTTSLADGFYHHVAVTRDEAGTAVFYVHGVVDATRTETADPASSSEQDLQIGFELSMDGPPPQPPTHFFAGQMDEVTLWNRVLSPTEIMDLYEDGLPAITSGLLGYWKMDEGVGQFAADVSGAPLLTARLGSTTSAESNDPTWACPPVGAQSTSSTSVLRLSVGSNPVHGPIAISFALAGGEPACIEIVDAAGRRVLKEDVSRFGTGRHDLSVDPDGRFNTGLYFVRLTQGEASFSRKLTWIR